MPIISMIVMPPAEPLRGAEIAGMTRADMECFARGVLLSMMHNMSEEDLRGYVDDLARQWVIAVADESDLPKDQNELDARAIHTLEAFTRQHQQELGVPQRERKGN